VEAANLVNQPELAHAAVVKILKRAEVLYKEGQEGLVHLPFRAAMAVAVASVLYREIGRKLLARSRKNAHLTMNQRTVVGGFAKLKCILIGSLIAIASRFQKKSPSLHEPPIQNWNYLQHFY
jgi:phytoene synthase